MLRGFFLLKDCSWFSSQNMDDISLSKVKIPTDALNMILTLVKVDRDELVVELKQFVRQYKNFLEFENQCLYPCLNLMESPMIQKKTVIMKIFQKRQ